MLSSPRWTTLDMYLVIALCIFALRALTNEPAHAGHGTEAPAAEVDPLQAPMPFADQIRRASLDHVYLAVRCLGLAEMQRQAACAGADATACLRAQDNLQHMEQQLWPKGRAGQFAMAFRSKADVYARAYAAATDGEYRVAGLSSQLILQRDSAMCRQSQAYYQARLDDLEHRQPG